VYVDEEIHYRTPYVWRVIPLPPQVAAAALSSCFDVSDSTASRRSGRWKRCRGSSCLVVRRETTPLSRGRYWWLRRFTGAVRLRAVGQRVELELLPWSTSRTELSLRPARGRLGLRLVGQQETYFAAANDLLDDLEAELLSNANAA
jgi:hypothetical protein